MYILYTPELESPNLTRRPAKTGAEAREATNRAGASPPPPQHDRKKAMWVSGAMGSKTAVDWWG